MNILLFGRNGRIGWELERTLFTIGHVTALGSKEINLADTDRVKSIIREYAPSLIVNAAAISSVDYSQDHIDLTRMVNSLSLKVISEGANRNGAGLIHFSSDYVFDGTKGSPYTEKDIPSPVNVYGETKLLGDQIVEAFCEAYLIIRTSWVYSLRRDNYLLNILRSINHKKDEISAPIQYGSPTWCRTLAQIVANILLLRDHSNIYDFFKRNKGIYNLAGEGGVSRSELVKEVILSIMTNNEKNTPRIKTVPLDEFFRVKRPLNTILDCSLVKSQFGIEIPTWTTSLALALDEFGNRLSLGSSS